MTGRSEADEVSTHVVLVFATFVLLHPLLLGLLGEGHELGHHPGFVVHVESDASGSFVGGAIEHVCL